LKKKEPGERKEPYPSHVRDAEYAYPQRYADNPSRDVHAVHFTGTASGNAPTEQVARTPSTVPTVATPCGAPAPCRGDATARKVSGADDGISFRQDGRKTVRSRTGMHHKWILSKRIGGIFFIWNPGRRSGPPGLDHHHTNQVKSSI
jgi:hypothetical protein